VTPEPLRRPNKKTQKQLDEEEAANKAKAAALRRARAKRWNWIFFWRGKNMRKKLNKKGECAAVLRFFMSMRSWCGKVFVFTSCLFWSFIADALLLIRIGTLLLHTYAHHVFVPQARW